MNQAKRHPYKAALPKEDYRGTERAYERCRRLRRHMMAKVKNSSDDSSAGNITWKEY